MKTCDLCGAVILGGELCGRCARDVREGEAALARILDLQETNR